MKLKTTSYIIIGLVILPFVVVLFTPVFIKLFTRPLTPDEEYWREIYKTVELGEMGQPQVLQPFVSIELDCRLYCDEAEPLVLNITKSDNCSIAFAEGLEDIFTANVEDGVLKIDLREDVSRYFEGTNFLNITMPQINKLDCYFSNEGYLNLHGFQQESMEILHPHQLFFYDCQIDTVDFKNVEYINLFDSKIGSFKLDNEFSTYIYGKDSQIGIINAWAKRSDYELELQMDGVGQVQLFPGDYSIDFECNKPYTITFPDDKAN